MRRCLVLVMLCAGLAVMLPGFGSAPAAGTAQLAVVNRVIIGCWGDADKGDSADLKLMFVTDGSMIRYDENQVENKKRTFGAWEMASKSTFLSIYWPAGHITRYTIKRIGPILHFSGLNGVSNFTLRKLEITRCWEPKKRKRL